MHLKTADSAEIFDDIIIGAGSSGAVIAARLSEDSRRQVLLIEAGPSYPTLDATPRPIQNASEPGVVLHGYNWNIPAQVRGSGSLKTASLTNLGLSGPGTTGGRTLSAPPRPVQSAPSAATVFDYAVGKVAGGSSAINNALALRGAPADYDEWGAQCGGAWSWEEVLPFFRALEDDSTGTSSLHGAGGPLPVRRDQKSDLASLQGGFMAACLGHGLAETKDHNDPHSTGVGIVPRNVVNNVRISTALAYLQPARGRPNLKIVSDATARRVMWKAGTTTCDGVEVLVDGKLRVYRGNRIVLCAGALNTPAILLRSGVGSPEAVEPSGIAVKLPLFGVGENLIDHPVVIMWAVPRPGACRLGEAAHQVLLRHTSGHSAFRNDTFLYMLSGIDTDLFPMLKGALRSPIGAGIAVCFTKPKSLGRVQLATADPSLPPRVTVNCLGNGADLMPLKAGIKLAWDLFQKPELCSQLERVHTWTSGMVASDTALDHAIRSFVRPSWHPVGTAKMGLSPEGGAVVDPTGRVYGAENLWVADASIMPSIPGAPTNLTCLMIGEKVAAQLRNAR